MNTETLKVGPGLLDPQGRWHPCAYAMHSETGRTLFHQYHPDEAKTLLERCRWLDGLRELCQRGWVRVGENGAVTDDMWNLKSAEELTQPQLDVLFDLLAAAHQMFVEAEPKPSWLGQYLEGLQTTLGLDPLTLEERIC